MKISAKAKDYRNERSIFFGVYRDVDEGDLEDAFIDGAQWMLEKACEYIKNQYPVHYQEWAELADEYVEQFKKAMEE